MCRTFFGLVIVTIGILYPFFQKLGIGKLPGDIYIEKENFKFYFPVVTSLLFSLLISFIAFIINKK
ncbi:DUF2905 domain-containing protein [Wolbachia endosymbiont (group A) of Udea olivalis]|uniref:DUF2905 domain-containing protein n=1 Tax=Wolbachia endosymbiont (group A) of Udea olivalis TaxID=3066183 RepID=UPI00397C5EC7